MQVTAMSDGTQSNRIPEDHLLDEYYTCLHGAYSSMQQAYEMRAYYTGLTQDLIAARLDVDKGLVSKRINGTENLTLKTYSYMATAMDCRAVVTFVPFENIGTGNYFTSTENVNDPVSIGPPGQPQAING